MKTRVGLLISVVPFIASFGALSAERQGGAKAYKTDMAVVGPGGEVLVYFKDGNDVVVRNCGDNYPFIKKRSDCVAVGAENRVPVDEFKRALKSQFLLRDSDKFKPLTEEKVIAYRSKAPNTDVLKQREKELDDKLARIQEFVKNYGSDDKSKKDLAETQKLLLHVRRELSSATPKQNAIRKFNELVDEIVDRKIASHEITAVSSGRDGDQASYTILKQFDASKGECGTDEIIYWTPGNHPNQPKEIQADKAAFLKMQWIHPAYADEITVERRIRDCSPLPGSIKTTKSGVSWQLVARKRDASTGKFYEVWKDGKSGLIWSDTLDSTYTHYNAVELNMVGKVIKEKACNSDESKRATARVSGKSFGLPTIEEFKKAEENGIRKVLPNMSNYWFLSTSVYSGYPAINASGFNGNDGHSYIVGRNFYYSVRCVGR